MSHMVVEVYEALKVAGVDDERARAAASAIPLAQDLMTRADGAELKAELKADIAELRSDIRILKFVYGPVVVALLLKLVFFP